MIYLSTY